MTSILYFSDKMILKTALDAEEGSSNITRTMTYFHSISEYMMELRHLLEKLRDDIELVNISFEFVSHKNQLDVLEISTKISFYYRGVAQDELNAADDKKIVGIALLTIISIITVLFYFFVRNALSVIKVFNTKFLTRFYNNLISYYNKTTGKDYKDFINHLLDICSFVDRKNA